MTATNFISSKDNAEERVMHSKSDNIKIANHEKSDNIKVANHDKADEAFDQHFVSRLSRYQQYIFRKQKQNSLF